MEDVFALIGKQNDILPMTTIEIIDYLKAMNKAQITSHAIQNNSNISLCFAVNHIICEVKPNERLVLRDSCINSGLSLPSVMESFG